MDFKSYAECAEDTAHEKIEDTIKETVSRIGGKSEEELLGEIIKQAQKDKAAGKLNGGELDKFYQTVAPMLSPAQTKKLNEILRLIK